MTKRGVSLALMVLVWAGYYLASKYLVGLTGSPYLTGMLLRASALVIYTLILLISGGLSELVKIKRVWHILLIIGVLGFALDLFANIGFKYSSASTGTALLKLDVLMTNVTSAIIFHKRLKLTDWLFTAVMLSGVIMTLDIDIKTLRFNYYDLFFVLSAAAVTANAFIIKYAQSKYNVPSDTIGYYNNFIALTLFTAAVIISGDGLRGLIDYKISGIIVLGGLMQCLIYIFYYYNLKRREVWIVKIILLLVPVVTALFSVMFLDEKLNLIKCAGIIAVLGGAVGILINKKEKLNENHNRLG
ncbi:MAG: DMT family transporter [Christensenellales bacterium]|jgi:drug/metabolite transporter (DMT)-like permease